MLAGKYKSNLEFTPEQMEMDDCYGIMEAQRREIEFSAPNTFKFTYHYYYESESNYVVTKSFSNDTVFSGTYSADGNRFVADILAGEQAAKVAIFS